MVALSQMPPSDGGMQLMRKRQEIQAQLRASPLKAPIVFETEQGDNHISGDLYAELVQPFATVSTALESPARLCGWLFLHLNVHGCELESPTASPPVIQMSAASRKGLAPGSMYQMRYTYQADGLPDKHRRVVLLADQGPVSTTDYRLVFEIAPIDAQTTLVHFSYAYRFGTLGRLAMQAYAATVGRSKVGFSVEGQDAQGKPIYLRGERSSVERALMRNYLALVAYASVPERAGQDPFEARLRAWFASSEQYSRQLHEIELDQYLDEKRKNRPVPHPLR